ncbi:MAG: hypothetical protein AAGF77_05390, partial [Bacteroidota bacterium]
LLKDLREISYNFIYPAQKPVDLYIGPHATIMLDRLYFPLISSFSHPTEAERLEVKRVSSFINAQVKKLNDFIHRCNSATEQEFDKINLRK